MFIRGGTLLIVININHGVCYVKQEQCELDELCCAPECSCEILDRIQALIHKHNNTKGGDPISLDHVNMANVVVDDDGIMLIFTGDEHDYTA